MCVSTLMHSFITNATKNQAPKADPTKANRGVWEGASGAAETNAWEENLEQKRDFSYSIKHVLYFLNSFYL